MQKYDEKLKICLKKYLTNLVCNLDDARDDVQKRVYNGNLTKSECGKNLHRTGGKRNPNKVWNCIFCESTRIWGQTTLVFGDC